MKTTFKFFTATGGLFSTVLYFIVGYTIVALMVRMIDRNQINIEVTNAENELIFNNETVRPFENDKFMVAFTVEFLKNNANI